MDMKLVDFVVHGDDRGKLIAISENEDYFFNVKRVYYIFDTKIDVRRGFHAHKKLKQLLICVNGSCTIHLDDGFEKKDVVLDNPSKGLLLSGVIWREMYNFSKNAVLVVLASEKYDEEDYIRNYDSFIDYVRGKAI